MNNLKRVVKITQYKEKTFIFPVDVLEKYYEEVLKNESNATKNKLYK